MIIDMHSHSALGFSDLFVNQWIKSHYSCLPAWFKDWKEAWKAEDFDLFTGDRWVGDMERAGIDKTVTWLPYMHPYDMHPDIESMARFAKNFPEHIIPFHGADPLGGHEEAERLRIAIQYYGFKGTKIYPTYNWHNPDDPRIFPIYEKCAELDIPCVIHTGFTFSQGAFLKHHKPEHLDAICFNFPQLKVIAAHCGFQWSDELFTLMFSYKNLYADLAWFMIYPIDWLGRNFAWAKHWGLIPRIMYGSDYPLTDSKTEGVDMFPKVKKYQEDHDLRPALTDEDIQMILGGNAERLLGI